MLVDENKYIWQKWQQPIFESNTTWGEVSATSSNESKEVKHPPFYALDGSVDTHWEGEDYVTNAQYMWVFEKPLRIYRIELVNKPSSGSNVTKNVEVYTCLLYTSRCV